MVQVVTIPSLAVISSTERADSAISASIGDSYRTIVRFSLAVRSHQPALALKPTGATDARPRPSSTCRRRRPEAHHATPPRHQHASRAQSFPPQASKQASKAEHAPRTPPPKHIRVCPPQQSKHPADRERAPRIVQNDNPASASSPLPPSTRASDKPPPQRRP